MAIKYDEIQWLMTQMSTVGPMFGQHVHFVRFAPKGNDYAQSRYTTQATRVAEVIENRLAHHAYLARRPALQCGRHGDISVVAEHSGVAG